MIEEISWDPHILDAARAIAEDIDPVHVTELVTLALPATVGTRIMLAHSNTHRRAAVWYLRSRRRAGELPREGIAVAADTEASIRAWALAATSTRTPAMLFVPSVLAREVADLRGDGVTVQVITDGDPVAQRDAYATTARALVPSMLDPLIAAGAGTWLHDVYDAVPEVRTVIIAGADHDDGLLLGTVAAAHRYGIKTVVVTPHGTPIPGAAQQVLTGEPFPGLASGGRHIQLESVTVTPHDIAAAHAILRRRGLQVADQGAIALSALTTTSSEPRACYRPERGETVAVLLPGPARRCTGAVTEHETADSDE